MTSPTPEKSRQRVTIPDLYRMKQTGEKIVSATAYDYTFSVLLDQAGVDLLLVGDSLGMVIQGKESTLAVTLEEMVYHTRAVARGAQRALVICDLPFGSYQSGQEAALTSAIRVLKEGEAHGVKLEWCHAAGEITHFLVSNGVPVIGHVGLTPQSIHAMGGFKVQGRGQAAAEAILAQAIAFADNGAAAVVLESIPAPLAAMVTQRLPIPTIGIGAGAECDGQVLVSYDLLGFYDQVRPRFVKRYLEGGALVRQAVADYGREVRDGTFPDRQHTFQE